MREWMALFIEGKPLYTVEEQNAESAEVAINQAVEEEKQQLLDDVDFSEYRVRWHLCNVIISVEKIR